MFETTLLSTVKKQRYAKLLALLCLAVMCLFSGCGETPPPTDTPEPSPHNGVFCSDYGTLTFNGDGESVTAVFEDNFAVQARLPQGKCQGTYAFKFQHAAYRYDKADSLELYIDGNTFVFQNRWQETNETVICLVSPLAAEKTIRFKM